MVRIDKAQREVNTQAIPHQYVDGGNTRGAFGENVALATQKAGEGLEDIGIMLDKIQAQNERANVVKLQNDVYQQWEEPNLYSKDGYFNQFGRNAAGKSAEVLANYDAWVEQRKKELGINSKRANVVFAEMNNRNRERISRAILAHDLQQTQEAEKTELSQLCKNYDTQGVWDRNSDEQFEYNMSEKIKAVKNYGIVANLDKTQINALMNNASEEYLNGVLTALLSDGNYQRAGKILENNKSYLSDENYTKFVKNIASAKTEDMSRQVGKMLASQGLTPTQAQSYVEKQYPNDFEMQDKTMSQYSYRVNLVKAEQKELEEKQERQLKQNVYSMIEQGYGDSEIISALSTSGLDPEQIEKGMKALQLVRKIESGGNDDVDYNLLLDEMIYNWDSFKTKDLTRYNLTKEQRNELLEKQRKRPELTAQSVLREAVKSKFSIAVGHDKWLGNMQGVEKDKYIDGVVGMLSNIELLTGKAFDLKNIKTNQELQNLIEAFGYKNPNQPNKNLDETFELFGRAFMRENQLATEYIDYYKNFKNYCSAQSFAAKEYAQFVATNKREPNAEEINGIATRTYNRVERAYSDAAKNKLVKNAAIYQQVRNITPKPNETKAATYFADVLVPQISRDLGKNFVVTSRYRNQSGSKHSQGICVDISMSEHDEMTRRKFVEEIYNYPFVKTIFTADPCILNVFPEGNLFKKMKSAKSYDTNYAKTHPNTNMNHKNHVHVELIGEYGMENGR